MSGQLVLVTPVAADREGWELLYRGYAKFYEVPMNDEILDTVWSWIQDADYPFHGIIAKNPAGDAIGLMHFRPMPSPLRGSIVGFLDDLFVSPDARGDGVVDALFDRLDQERQKRGWPMVRWITGDDNYRARGVYDKLAKRTHFLTYQMEPAAKN